MPDMTTTTGGGDRTESVRASGITHDDVDVAEIYDSFTYTALVTLEDLGFCETGAGGEFVAGGTTAPGGELPMNTRAAGSPTAIPATSASSSSSRPRASSGRLHGRATGRRC